MRRRWWTTIAAVLLAAGLWTASTGVSAAAVTDQLTAGQVLAAGQQLTSTSGAYRLVMQGDGNVVLYGPTGARWASRTFVPGTTLTMQGDGNLVAYTPARQAVWNTGTAGSGAVRAVMQDDGNVVLVRSDGRAVWATNTAVPPSRLLSGQRLLATQSLLSPNAAYRLVMQGDGNLVLYGPHGAAWATRTAVAGTVLVLQGDGNLVAYAPGGRPVWSTGTAGSGANQLVMQNDGNVVLYRATGSAVWATGTVGGAPICPGAPYGVNHYAPGAGRTVALTFDDGPGASTAEIVQILLNYRVTATFFNVGESSAALPSLVQTEYRDHFLLGNHTWSHANMITLPAPNQAAEMDRATNEQVSLTVTRPCFFRPPYGNYNATTLSLAQARAMKVFNWSVDTEDWKAAGSGSQYWINRIINYGTAGGSQSHPVVLMHNQSGPMPATVAALPAIIAYYQGRGYTFVDLAGRVAPR